MRFLALIIVALGLVPAIFAQDAFDHSSFNSERVLDEHLEKRVLTLNICENLVLTIPGITLLGIPLLGITLSTPICVCLAGGVITPQSLVRIRLSVSTGGSNVGLVRSLLKLVGGTVDLLVSTLANIARPILSSDSTSCVYPADSVPDDCSGSCGYVCAANFVACNSGCIATGSSCSTGGSRKRRIPTKKDLMCPIEWEACMVPAIDRVIRWTGRSFDCVDARTDLESCGGCAFPMAGQKMGRDCTAIPSVASVSCEKSKCIVRACVRGFAVNGTECIPRATDRLFGRATVWSLKD